VSNKQGGSHRARRDRRVRRDRFTTEAQSCIAATKNDGRGKGSKQKAESRRQKEQGRWTIDKKPSPLRDNPLRGGNVKGRRRFKCNFKENLQNEEFTGGGKTEEDRRTEFQRRAFGDGSQIPFNNRGLIRHFPWFPKFSFPIRNRKALGNSLVPGTLRGRSLLFHYKGARKPGRVEE